MTQRQDHEVLQHEVPRLQPQRHHLLLHVIDIADDRLVEHKKAVEELLRDLEVEKIPRLLVLNKADRLPAARARELEEQLGGVAISALKGEGLEHLIEIAEAELDRGRPLLRTFDGEDPGAG